MEKVDYKKRAADLKKEVSKNKVAEEESGKICINEKICPFMTSPDKQVACTSQCKIYRTNKKKAYACPISELPCISFNTKKAKDEDEDEDES